MTALPTFNAGTFPTGSQLQTLLPTMQRRSTDSTAVNNSTTLVNDSSLLWGLNTLNVTYEFRMLIIQNANTTANFKYAFTFPAGCRMDFGHATYIVGGTNTATFLGFVNYTSGTAIAVSGSGGDAAIHINGTISVGGTSGNLQFQFAQNTANVSNTVVRAGSFGTLRQVA